LLIQPLVENAIQHGCAGTRGPADISVRAHRTGASIAIEVEDTGAGVAPGWSLDRASGTGLKNLRERLSALYGPAGALEAGPRPGGGFRVRLTLPGASTLRPL
jgi:LytS/YehU family sensor histidine kinase